MRPGRDSRFEFCPHRRLLLPRTGELCGETDIYIYPGFEFEIIDAMITNFHLPKSSLIMMISAFLGLDNVKKIYKSR